MVERNRYKNKRCFIIGTSSSISNVDMSLLKDEVTLSLNLILKHPTFVPNYLCIADTTVMENNYDDIFNDKMSKGTYVICNGCNILDKRGSYGKCTKNSGSTCRGIDIEDKYNNIYYIKHDEKLGINDNEPRTINEEKYYIDDDFKTITSYGGSTIDNLVIPLAVYLGFKEIYLLGCDGGWNHFYDEVQKSGKRDWINYKHVIKLLDNYGVKLLNCDHTNYFKELEYVKLEEVLK